MHHYLKNKKLKNCSVSESDPPSPDDNCIMTDVKTEISEDQSETDVPSDAVIICSPHDDNGDRTLSPDENEEVQQNVQSSNSSQIAKENPILIPVLSSPFTLGQWQQPPYPQNGCSLPGLLQRQPLNPIPELVMPFRTPQRPSHHFHRAIHPPFYQPTIPPEGTTDATSPKAGGGISRSQQHSPSFSPVCYPYPGFPGPRDPSSWLNLNYSVPLPTRSLGSFNRSPFSQTKKPSCQSASASPIQKGTVRPPAELSPEHRQPWEAQSLQNVQLWNIVGELQSELAEYKSRVQRLETYLESLKPVVQEGSNHGTGDCVGGKRKAPKTEMPEKLVSSSGEFYSSWPPVRNQMRGLHKAQFEARKLHYKKVILKKANYEDSAPRRTDGTGDTQSTNSRERKGSSGPGRGRDRGAHGASTALNGEVSKENLIKVKGEDAMVVGGSDSSVLESQQVDGTGTISSSKTCVELNDNPLVKKEQKEVEDESRELGGKLRCLYIVGS